MGRFRHTRPPPRHPAWAATAAAAGCAAVAGLCALAGVGVRAATIPTSASFSVGATVANGCFVNGSPSQTSGVNFGLLDFGAHPALTAGSYTVSASGASQALLYCTPNTTVQVTINAGLHAIGTQRYLANGTGATLPYSVVLATTPPVPMLPGVAASLPLTGTAMAVPLTGTVTYPGAAATTGMYTDTVQVVVSW